MEPMETAAEASETTPPAFEAFFLAERDRLLRAVFLLTGNAEEAEEIVQDAFVAIWERWDRVRGLDDPTGYLYRTALNRHRSRVRRALRVGRRAVGHADGGDQFAEVDERDAIARALASLSPRRRQAVVLVELRGHDSASAGRVMGVTAVTVRRLASDARAHLRQQLRAAEDG